MPKLLGLSLLLIALDAGSKIIASTYMQLYQSIVVIDGFFNVTLAHNHGAAFSFLADQGGWQRWLFLGLSAIISLWLLLWIIRLDKQQKLLGIALAMIIGGALGNFLDRALFGYVIDFLDVYIRLDQREWHWPIFNLADSFISIGAVLLLLDSFFSRNNIKP